MPEVICRLDEGEDYMDVAEDPECFNIAGDARGHALGRPPPARRGSPGWGLDFRISSRRIFMIDTRLFLLFKLFVPAD